MNKNLENIENLIKVINTKHDEIVEMSKECYQNTMDGSCFQGWNVGVIAHTDGTIDTFYRSQNTSSFAEQDREAIAVINYTTGNDVPTTEYTKDDLTKKEVKKFKKFLIENEYIENIEEWEDELTYDRLDEFDSDIIARIDIEAIEADVEEYYQQYAEEKIDSTLEYLQQELENEQEYEE